MVKSYGNELKKCVLRSFLKHMRQQCHGGLIGGNKYYS